MSTILQHFFTDSVSALVIVAYEEPEPVFLLRKSCKKAIKQYFTEVCRKHTLKSDEFTSYIE